MNLPKNAFDYIPQNKNSIWGRRPTPGSNSETLKLDHKAVPPEVFDVFGRFMVFDANGAIYGRIKSKNIPMTRLVWWCHYPDERFPPHGKPVFHLDGNKQNNQFSNLTMKRELYGSRNADGDS